jgi:hypothetical protein
MQIIARNWKIDQDAQTYPIAGDYIQWTYMDALSAGLFTANPEDVFDEDVCDVSKSKLALEEPS